MSEITRVETLSNLYETVQVEYSGYTFAVTYKGDKVVKIAYLDGVEIPKETYLGRKIIPVAIFKRQGGHTNEL